MEEPISLCVCVCVCINDNKLVRDEGSKSRFYRNRDVKFVRLLTVTDDDGREELRAGIRRSLSLSLSSYISLTLAGLCPPSPPGTSVDRGKLGTTGPHPLGGPTPGDSTSGYQTSGQNLQERYSVAVA